MTTAAQEMQLAAIFSRHISGGLQGDRLLLASGTTAEVCVCVCVCRKSGRLRLAKGRLKRLQASRRAGFER